MNTSGEAADQVVRMVLEGTEYVVRLSGKGAVQLGALVYSIARQQKKNKRCGATDQYAPQRQSTQGLYL